MSQYLDKSNLEVEEILSRPPRWIVRWGMTIILAFVVIFLVMSWMIRYPDIIPAQVNITTERPVIPVVANASGKIVQLYVQNEQYVEAGEIIAVIDNSAEWEDIQQLEQLLYSIHAMLDKPGIQDLELPNNLTLGSLQQSYASLSQKVKNYKYLLQQSIAAKKIASLKEQIKHLNQLNENIQKQKMILKQELKLEEKNYQRNLSLRKDSAISDAQLEIVEAQYLQKKSQLESIENQMINNNVTISQLDAQIADLSHNRSDQIFQQEQSINEIIEAIKRAVESWKSTFLIVAPIAGQISFAQIWSEQQFVTLNQEILTVVPPEGSGKIIGKAMLPITNSGKVKVGQRVNIQLAAFPYQEFGIIKSEVGNISLVPSENVYFLEIELPDSLVTTYGKSIPFKQKMQGVANIITEDRSILARVFDRIYNILKNT